VAPTVSIVEAPAGVYVPLAGLLAKVFTIILLVPPSLIVTSVVGIVIVKDATVATGAKGESVTPPVALRTPAGVNTTVPALAPLIAVPKCKPTVFEIVSGAIITAAAVDEAVTCAKVAAVKANITSEIASNFFICFIFSFFWLANIKLKFLN
jgi:hypothetical protein